MAPNAGILVFFVKLHATQLSLCQHFHPFSSISFELSVVWRQRFCTKHCRSSRNAFGAFGAFNQQMLPPMLAFEVVAMGMAMVRFGMAALVQKEVAALKDLLPGHSWDLDPCDVEWMITCEECHVVEIHLEDVFIRALWEIKININFLHMAFFYWKKYHVESDNLLSSSLYVQTIVFIPKTGIHSMILLLMS